jgi:type IV pilus assembly protein PilC
MKTFKYVARDLAGEKKEGLKQASSSGDVLSFLREQQFIPVFIEEVQEALKRKEKRHSRRRHINSGDLSTFCWQFSTMIEGGISITVALETIAEDLENAYFRDVLRDVSESINKGESFLGGVAKYPDVFNHLSRAIILAGESSGSLANAVRRLAVYYENRDKLAKKVKAAIAYPIFIVCFIIVVIAVIMTFIIPRFQTMFEQFGNKLPPFTVAFMGVYNVLRVNIIFFLVGLFIFVAAMILIYTKTAWGHRFFSKLSLRLPLFGRIFRQSFIAIYCRTMSTLLGAGVSVLEVFDILAEMSKNDVIKDAITGTKQRVVEGQGIASSMSKTTFFTNMVIKMTQVGEESGSMTDVLDKTADYYDRRVEATIQTVMSLIEPIMIIVIGSIVLVIVIALYLPIFSISDVKQ